MSETIEVVEAIQADRKAARIALNNATIRRSKKDALSFLTDLFARHRLTHSTPVPAEEYARGLEDAAKAIRDHIPARLCEAIPYAVKAIRSLKGQP